MNRVQIAGVGHYLPPRIVDNVELASRLGCDPDWIARTTGVLQRHWCAGESSSEMAVRAARRAAQTQEEWLTGCELVIGASTAPEQSIPCTAALVAESLQLPPGQAFAFDINATCLSFLTGLQAAANWLDQRPARTALLFSSEIASVSLNLNEPAHAVLFGDAAAAVVLRPTPPGETSHIAGSRFATYPDGARLAEFRGGGTRHHPNHPATLPEMNTFAMQGPAIFRLAVKTLGDFLDRFFAELPWPRAEIDAVVPHQAMLLGVEQMWKRFGFRREQVLHNIAQRGNCVAASMPLLLSEAVAEGRIRRGDRVLFVGSAAGFSLGAVALEY